VHKAHGWVHQEKLHLKALFPEMNEDTIKSKLRRLQKFG